MHSVPRERWRFSESVEGIISAGVLPSLVAGSLPEPSVTMPMDH